MARLKASKRSELEGFWRAHLDGWRGSELNQREYCEVHGLPLKRFGNWRAKYRHEDCRYPRKVLYRRNGDLSRMISPMTREVAAAPLQSGLSGCDLSPATRRSGVGGSARAAADEG